MRAAKMDHDLGLDERPDDDVVRRHSAARRRLAVRDQGRPDPRRPAHPRRRRPTGEAELDLVLAILRARQMFGGEQTRARAARRRWAWPRTAPTTGPPSTPSRRRPAHWSPRCRTPAGTPAAVDTAHRQRRRRRASCGSPPPRWCRGWPAPPTRSTRSCTRSTAASSPAGPSGSPLRGLVNVLPTGRNFYSVDPKAVPSRLAWETGAGDGRLAAGPLPRRPRRAGRSRSGLSVWGTSAMRTAGDDIAEVLALLGRPAGLGRGVPPGRRPRADRRWPSSAGPRIDVTVRISGFFRDAFPHVVAHARRRRAAGRRASTSPPSDNYVRAHAQADLAEHGDERRATTRIFGSKPGTYGAGLLQLIDSRQLARRRRPRRGLHRLGRLRLRPRPRRRARPPTTWTAHYRRIAVAAKNTDTREHDIADSDDYFQYHGGMVATVRALTGTRPGRLHRRLHPARRGAHPHAVRGDHAGVPGPGGQPALDRPRCAGTATRARSRWPPPSTTCSATTPPPAWWPTGCTSSSPRATCSTPENRKFMAESNPWALHGMAERLLEAADRGMWAQPEAGHARRPARRCCWRPKATSRAEPLRLMACLSPSPTSPSPNTSC